MEKEVFLEPYYKVKRDDPVKFKVVEIQKTSSAGIFSSKKAAYK